MQPTDASRPDRSREAFYLWEVPGKPIAVQISHQVMDRMLLDVLEGLGRMSRGRGAEVGGILLGVAERHAGRRVLRIEDFLHVPCEHAFGPSYRLSENDRREFSRTLAEWRRSGDRRLYAVGFWRSHTREDFALSPEDLELLSAHFSSPDCVALLVRPQGVGPALGGFFFWEGGRIQSEACYRTFQFGRQAPVADGAVSSGGAKTRETFPRPRDQSLERESHLSPPRDAPSPGASDRGQHDRSSGESPRAVRHGLLWILLAAVLLTLLVAGTVLVAGRGKILLVPAQGPGDPFSLSLVGREYDGNVQLTWDRRAAPVRMATSGTLVVTDGDQVRRLDLSQEQIRTGSVVYQRISDRVSFRLELSWGRRGVWERWTYEAPLGGGSGAAPPGP